MKNYKRNNKIYGLNRLNGYPYPSAAKQQNLIRVIRNEVAKFNS